MDKQPSLFAKIKEDGYPIIMVKEWKDYKEIALVDTPEKRKELEAEGYIVEESENDGNGI